MRPLIVFTDCAKLRDRCQITTVVVRDHPAYEDGAVVPTGQWTPISPAEADLLRAPHHVPEAEAVELVAFRCVLRCLRLRLAPGEGYLAPTELLPHDGSTMDIPEPSTAAFWLDHWPIGAFPSLI
ncbi:hypothetical protein ACIRRH_02975 [Kitasatospora sp. NPDC101235]|uniref:hypothetical protein n=1 Tax=Kitasatospora sp. NPDC101235 TaxID=3364101 RepID=UPI00380CEC0A